MKLLAGNFLHRIEAFRCKLARLIRLRAATFIAMLAMLVSPCYSSAAEKQVQCTVLEQVTSTHGSVTTFVTPAAVKMQFTDVNAYIIARGPSWRVMLVNADSKLVFECPYDAWLKHSISRSYLGAEPDEQQDSSLLTKGHDTRYASATCELYFINKRFRDGRQGRVANYYVLADPKPDPHPCKILEKWLAVPFIDAIPVSMKWYDPVTGETYRSTQNKKLSSVQVLYADNVDTKRVSKRSFNDSFFAYPQNFQLVKSENDIFSTKQTRHDAETIFGELENMKPPGESTGKSKSK